MNHPSLIPHKEQLWGQTQKRCQQPVLASMCKHSFPGGVSEKIWVGYMIFFSKPSSYYERIPASCSHDVIITPKYLILRFANCPDSKYTDTPLLTISDMDQINSTGFTATRSVHLLAPPSPPPPPLVYFVFPSP